MKKLKKINPSYKSKENPLFSDRVTPDSLSYPPVLHVKPIEWTNIVFVGVY